MLLIGAELLRIGKNLYVTKSEPGANHVGTTRRKNIKTSEWRQAKRLFNNYNVLYNDNALIINRPKRRFFVIPKKTIKTKVLTANYSRQNDCKIIITDVITHVPCRNIEKIRIIKSGIQKTFS